MLYNIVNIMIFIGEFMENKKLEAFTVFNYYIIFLFICVRIHTSLYILYNNNNNKNNNLIPSYFLCKPPKNYP